jgi:hypothetical protein
MQFKTKPDFEADSRDHILIGNYDGVGISCIRLNHQTLFLLL